MGDHIREQNKTLKDHTDQAFKRLSNEVQTGLTILQRAAAEGKPKPAADKGLGLSASKVEALEQNQHDAKVQLDVSSCARAAPRAPCSPLACVQRPDPRMPVPLSWQRRVPCARLASRSTRV